MSDITMFNINLCRLSKVCVVELTICIYTFRTILEFGMANDPIRICMVMVPNKRNRFSVIMLKSIFTDYATIRSLKVVLCGPTTKVKLFIHFDFLLLYRFL